MQTMYYNRRFHRYEFPMPSRDGGDKKKKNGNSQHMPLFLLT